MREELAGKQDVFNTALFAIDPHEEWSAKFLLKRTGLSTEDVNFPLLMDPSLTVSATYGVAFQMRVHREISNRPATFIVDREGILRYAHRGKTYGNRPVASHIKAELRKLMP